MQPKTLFLLKVLGISIALFLLWPFLAKPYGWILDHILSVLDPNYGSYELSSKWIYTASLFLIPLFALVTVSPRVKMTKKFTVIGVGIILSILIDCAKVILGVNGNSIGYVIYFSLKWLSPLMLWMAVTYPSIGDILNPQEAEPDIKKYVCPICGEEHGAIINHIRKKHRTKSLKIKKVRRFLQKNPELCQSAMM